MQCKHKQASQIASYIQEDKCDWLIKNPPSLMMSIFEHGGFSVVDLGREPQVVL